MTALFSSPPKPSTITPAQVPTPTDPGVQQAQRDAATAAANAAGRGSTILTSGQGDTSAASIGKKVLLGG